MTEMQSIPLGFYQIESAIEGITVFTPIPATDSAAIIAEYKCPNCGAPTQYDIAAGGIACQGCGFTAPASGEPIGRSAGKYEFTPDTLSQAKHPWTNRHFQSARKAQMGNTIGKDNWT